MLNHGEQVNAQSLVQKLDKATLDKASASHLDLVRELVRLVVLLVVGVVVGVVVGERWCKEVVLLDVGEVALLVVGA